MPALATTADGNYVYAALETTGGTQIITRAARTDLSTWTAVYSPGGGTACNVVQMPSDEDLMVFYGNFGSGIGVIVHTVSTVTNTDKSPASLSTKVINTLTVNPDNADEMWCTVDTDQDLLYTPNGGDDWITLNAALGFNATGLATIYLTNRPDRAYIGGNNGVTLDVLFTADSGATTTDKSGATLGAADGIVGIEAVRV